MEPGRCEGCGAISSFRRCYRCMHEMAGPARDLCGAAGRGSERCTLDRGHAGVFHEVQRHGAVLARWPIMR